MAQPHSSTKAIIITTEQKRLAPEQRQEVTIGQGA